MPPVGPRRRLESDRVDERIDLLPERLDCRQSRYVNITILKNHLKFTKVTVVCSALDTAVVQLQFFNGRHVVKHGPPISGDQCQFTRFSRG